MTTNLLQQERALIPSYFPLLSKIQKQQFDQLASVYTHWNQCINVISKKDIQHLYLHHVLHSLSIAKVVQFLPHIHILDLGTGGGFPGIPLAILFPNTQFTLIDSIAKKMKVVSAVVKTLGLTNVKLLVKRVESINQQYDFITARAVAPLPILYKWGSKLISKDHKHAIPNGFICLKGGNIDLELAGLPLKHTIYPIIDYFQDPYFTEKKIVHAFF